jgi:hypothetical protein
MEVNINVKKPRSAIELLGTTDVLPAPRAVCRSGVWMRSGVGLSLSGGVCKGVEHALPDLVGWGVDARGG